MAAGSSVKRPWDAIVWWEFRRIPFNLVLLVAGITVIIIVGSIGSQLVRPGEDVEEPLGLILGGIVYGLTANVFYTLGWITELLWSGGDTGRTEAMRPKLFRLGLIFSAFITFLPAILIPLVWAIWGFQHGQ